ncbi:hypothetical protein [Pseudochelatococcus contaminans]|uniref:Uncharacterized protein n=1 Tax=Pseudochelatococcus contaminans TaxID=1538103 RepID=A0A7W5Z8Q7_9HYPH|nr:hypothetical protein [Pseudochelatococcus contaminans]MBB3811456.1 hypothetical protein [Pseudochelatococcus contaminans]
MGESKLYVNRFGLRIFFILFWLFGILSAPAGIYILWKIAFEDGVDGLLEAGVFLLAWIGLSLTFGLAAIIYKMPLYVAAPSRPQPRTATGDLESDISGKGGI